MRHKTFAWLPARQWYASGEEVIVNRYGQVDRGKVVRWAGNKGQYYIVRLERNNRTILAYEWELEGVEDES